MKDNDKWVETIEDPKHKEAMEKIIEYKKLKAFYEEKVVLEYKNFKGETVNNGCSARHIAIQDFIGDGALTDYIVTNESCEQDSAFIPPMTKEGREISLKQNRHFLI